MSARSYSLSSLSEPIWRRCQRMRAESAQRMDVDQVSNEEWMRLLLDVYEYHLETEVSA